MLDRMEMVGLKSGMRRDRFDRFGKTLRVIREGCGDMEAEVLALLKTWPGILPILRCRFMSYQDPVMRILDHHHTVVRAQRVVAVNVTLCRWGAGKQLLKHLLWRGQVRANGIHPAFDRRLSKRNQEQGGKEERTVPEADPADHREVAGQPDHTVEHMLGGRDALDLRGEVQPPVLVIQGGTLCQDEPVCHWMRERRQVMHIDVVGFLAPTEFGLRPQCLLKVVLAQITLDNRRAVFHRRAHKGVLVHLRDSRRKLPLYGDCHLPSFATTALPGDTWRRG